MKLTIRMCDTPPATTETMLGGRDNTGLEDVTCWNIFEVQLDAVEYGKLFRMAYRAFTSLTNGSEAVWMAKVGPKAAFVLHMKGEHKKIPARVRDYLSGVVKGNGKVADIK